MKKTEPKVERDMSAEVRGDCVPAKSLKNLSKALETQRQ